MINKLIIDTLKPLNIPVNFQKYEGKANTYITFFVYNELGEAFADNEEVSTGYYIQIDIWSKSDYTSLVANVKDLLKNVGFTRTSEQDLYEQDTGVYHKGIRFFYCKNNEI